MHSIDPDH